MGRNEPILSPWPKGFTRGPRAKGLRQNPSKALWRSHPENGITAAWPFGPTANGSPVGPMAVGLCLTRRNMADKIRNTIVIAVGNQKGGVGKTTNTIQIAGALTERGRRSPQLQPDHPRRSVVACELLHLLDVGRGPRLSSVSRLFWHICSAWPACLGLTPKNRPCPAS